MLSTGYRSFSSFCPVMKGILLELIRDDFQPLLQLPATLSDEAWALAISKADPVFFHLNDGARLMQIGEASHQRLLECLKAELGTLK